MTIGSILLSVSLFLIVLAYLVRPFFVAVQEEDSSSRLDLLDKKDRLLTQIQALDFEFETNKIPETAYQIQRKQLIEDAAKVLQQFETSIQSAKMQDIDAKIEAAIEKLKGTTGSQQAPCPNCNNPVGSNDKFCSNCGHKLENVSS